MIDEATLAAYEALAATHADLERKGTTMPFDRSGAYVRSLKPRKTARSR